MNLQDIKLQGNRILLILEKPMDTSVGGIYLPETIRAERNVGTIILIGDSCDRKFEHRRAMFTPSVGEKVFFDGIESIIMYSHDIIAFLN